MMLKKTIGINVLVQLLVCIALVCPAAIARECFAGGTDSQGSHHGLHALACVVNLAGARFNETAKLDEGNGKLSSGAIAALRLKLFRKSDPGAIPPTPFLAHTRCLWLLYMSLLI